MVIQRIQTLFLLIASALCITFIFTPFGYTAIIEDGQQAILEPLYAKNIVGLLIPAAASALILLIDIFLFKNMPLQKPLLGLVSQPYLPPSAPLSTYSWPDSTTSRSTTKLPQLHGAAADCSSWLPL